MNTKSFSTGENLFNHIKKVNKYKDELCIAITDSGLGGLSVVAELENKLKSMSGCGKIDLIFFNAYAGKGYGYNEIKDEKKKIQIFDNVLKDAGEKFKPDIILIACNTLSVIYDKTEFFGSTGIPVLGIVEFGVEMLEEKMREDPSGTVILLGTPTTIQSGAHKTKLLNRGIPEERIISQSCRNLESEIQKAPDSKEVDELISSYITQALTKIEYPYEKIYACLCCTHYGYAVKSFRKHLPEHSEVLNPNERMAEVFSQVEHFPKEAGPQISVKVYSKNEIAESERINLAGLLEKNSPGSAEALRNYKLDRDLFHVG